MKMNVLTWPWCSGLLWLIGLFIVGIFLSPGSFAKHKTVLGTTSTKTPEICPPNKVINSMVTGPVHVRSKKSLLVTPNGEVILSNGVEDEGAIKGSGNDICVVNQGLVETIDGDNAPAIFITGTQATVNSSGTLKMTGNNSPGIEIRRGIQATVKSSGRIISGETEDDNNNEGISIVGAQAWVQSSGSFTSIGQNSEWISLVGPWMFLDAEGDFFSNGSNSEAYSISGPYAEAHIRGTYKTMMDNSELISLSETLDSTLDINASFVSHGKESEAISVSGSKVQIKSRGPITTMGPESEGISLSGQKISLTRYDPIITSGDDAEGISSQGNLAHIILNPSASISTGGLDSEGISMMGAGSVLKVNGPITTDGIDSEGISAMGWNIVVNVNQTIETKKGDSEGVSVTGKRFHFSLTGQGAITTNGTLSEGLSLVGEKPRFGGKALAQIQGSITTKGKDSPGIVLDHKAVILKIMEQASVQTEQTNSPGIWVVGDGANIDFAGSIETSGGSAGILISGDNVTLRCRPGASIVTLAGGNPIDVTGNNVKVRGCPF